MANYANVILVLLSGFYPTKYDKLWLALNAYQEAKAAIVEENGIGEDLTFNLLGWHKDRLAVSCKVTQHHKGGSDQKLLSLLAAGEYMRTCWGVTAFTFMSEGYIAKDSNNIDTKEPFPIQFANGNPNIIESLIFAHIENNETTVVNTPYKYNLGKKVSYGNPICATSDNKGKLFNILHQILNDLTPDPPTENPEGYYTAVADHLETFDIDTHWFTKQ